MCKGILAKSSQKKTLCVKENLILFLHFSCNFFRNGGGEWINMKNDLIFDIGTF